jgi:hypothetical protein
LALLFREWFRRAVILHNYARQRDFEAADTVLKPRAIANFSAGYTADSHHQGFLMER